MTKRRLKHWESLDKHEAGAEEMYICWYGMVEMQDLCLI